MWSMASWGGSPKLCSGFLLEAAHVGLAGHLHGCPSYSVCSPSRGQLPSAVFAEAETVARWGPGRARDCTGPRQQRQGGCPVHCLRAPPQGPQEEVSEPSRGRALRQGGHRRLLLLEAARGPQEDAAVCSEGLTRQTWLVQTLHISDKRLASERLLGGNL